MTVRIPMKSTDTTNSQDQLISDPNYVFEQKFDGTRGLAVITPGNVWFPGYQGKGALAHTAATQWLPTINPALLLALTVPNVDFEIVLDGEIMIGTGEYRIFDAPYIRYGTEVVVQPSDPFHVRRSALETFPFDPPIHIVRQALGPAAKAALLQEVYDKGGEGIMAKHLDKPYQAGQRADHQLKIKFVKTADVVVTGSTRARNKEGREIGGFTLGCYDNGTLVTVGGCSAIGKPHVELGDVIEVNYLYWTGGALYQPRMSRVREDKPAIECTIDQFKPYTREAI